MKEMVVTTEKADEMIDLHAENQKLKLENGILKGIIETMKSHGFESEIKYIENKIKNTLKKYK